MSSIATQNVKPTPLGVAVGRNFTSVHGLPEGFPSAVPNAWAGEDFIGVGIPWVYHLEPAECVEIKTGLSKFKGKLTTPNSS